MGALSATLVGLIIFFAIVLAAAILLTTYSSNPPAPTGTTPKVGGLDNSRLAALPTQAEFQLAPVPAGPETPTLGVITFQPQMPEPGTAQVVDLQQRRRRYSSKAAGTIYV